MHQESLFYILAPIAVVLAGISKSGFGTGLGVFAVPLMAIVIPPAQAAAIMLPILCAIDLFNIWHYRRSWDRQNLSILLPAALLGIALGAFTFRYLSDAHIRVLIGLIALVFVGNFFFGRTTVEKKSPDRLRGSFWGAIAGFVSFGVHAGGPPVSVYLLPQRLEKSIFVGTNVVFFTIVNYVKLIPYYFLGQLNVSNLTTSLILSPLIPVGIWLGVKLHGRINQRLFYRLVYLFLLIAGVKLLYDGIVNI
ncbi:MAG: sulfite exporter TauE/SafE family protein [Anaerolineales bacterium]|nr:sulfite exporter TauE/SafE family protein [Chloroflexota bacterium]MBL7161398.1 sulfite exporter TauE/SafE family protein [Anaerolineales bacterium]